jgi:hypothetical protein
MAIYSLHHSSIGKATQQRPHTAAAHVVYITRGRAATRVDGARMPLQRTEAVTFLQQAEDTDRVNARVADKVLVALPRELNAEQRVRLVRCFAEDVTKGRASWIAAFHEGGKDAHNPHAHILIRDRDPQTGRRVAGLSERGSTERLRQLWEKHANSALKAARTSQRIDRRSLEAQGIDREPTIHEGPRAQAMDRRGVRPRSAVRRYRNRAGSRSAQRSVDYRRIDQGRSRPDYNRQLRAPRQETARDYWAAYDRDVQAREMESLGARGSVDNVRAFPLQGIQTDYGNIAPVPIHVGALAGSDGPRDPRVLFRPLPFEPGADRVTNGPGIQPGGESIRPGPEGPRQMGGVVGNKPGDVFPSGVEPGPNTPYHTDSVGSLAGIRKEGCMRDEQELQAQKDQDYFTAKRDADLAQARYDRLMGQAYRDPQAAEKKFAAFESAHGKPALYQKLDEEGNNPKSGSIFGSKFGRRPGSIASLDGYKPGASDKQQQASIARRELPGAVRNHHSAQERLQTARDARGLGQPVPQPQQPMPPSPQRQGPQAPTPQARPQQQMDQHRGMERSGQPPAPSPQQPAGPNWATMSPNQRQASQHKLMERPTTGPQTPTMPMPPGPAPTGPAASPGAAPNLAPARKRGFGMG